MTEAHPTPRWKKKVEHEFAEYIRIFLYLSVFFCVFAWHRRLILAQEHHPIDDLWVPLIEAAVLAKVLLILDLVRIGPNFKGKPLIFPTLYRALIFGLGIAVFSLLEQTVRGLFEHKGVLYGVQALTGEDWHALVVRALVKLVALFPFVAIRELERVLGDGALGRLFFRSPELRPPTDDSSVKP